jgi:hypothetical protein
MTTHQTVLAFLFAACLLQGVFLVTVIVNLDDGDNRRPTLVLAALILCFCR